MAWLPERLNTAAMRLTGMLGLCLSTSFPVAAAGDEFYCCQDPANGRRVCGDLLPDACRGRGYKVLDRGGNVLREVGPPLTAEQKAQIAAEKQRKAREEEMAREQRRVDQALLDTYSSPDDIDLAQEKAEADVRLAMDAAREQIELSLKKRRKLEDEAEFYKKKTLPPELDKGLRAVDHEIRLQKELIAVKEKEFAAIKAKYDADRQRYQALTGRSTRTTTPSPAVTRLPPR